MKVELLAVTPDAEKIIEIAARTCYQSEPNDSTTGSMILKLIRSGHHSVLEHGYATFKISDVSRALTHQLVRHRLCAFSQQSQRYVKESQFDFVIPTEIEKLGEHEKINFMGQMSQIQDMYNYWKAKGVKNEDARFVLPNACHTQIVMSADFREWRHVFELRCDKHAQWEIRELATKMLAMLHVCVPHVFRDLKEKFIDGINEPVMGGKVT